MIYGHLPRESPNMFNAFAGNNTCAYASTRRHTLLMFLVGFHTCCNHGHDTWCSGMLDISEDRFYTPPPPPRVVYRGFCLNSVAVAVSKVTSRRWWCIESLFPILVLIGEGRVSIPMNLEHVLAFVPGIASPPGASQPNMKYTFARHIIYRCGLFPSCRHAVMPKCLPSVDIMIIV